MEKINKKVQNYLGVLTILVVVLTAFQGLIPTMPITNTITISIISAVILFLVNTLTAWKQYLSKVIDNKAIIPIAIMCLLALVGGLNDLFKVFPFDDITNQWIRFGFTCATLVLNLLSQLMFPKEETIS